MTTGTDAALRFSADRTRAIVSNGRTWDCCTVTWHAEGHYTLRYAGLCCDLWIAEKWLAGKGIE